MSVPTLGRSSWHTWSMAKMRSKAKCRVTGQVRLTKAQADRLSKMMPTERYKWCEHCKWYHRTTRPALIDAP